MKNTKMGAAPEKAETMVGTAKDKPFDFVPLEKPKELRHVSTDTAKPVYEEPRISFPRRGPMAGMTSARDFVVATATDAEIAAFKAQVEKRLAKDPGTWQFWICDNPRCREVFRLRPEDRTGTACVICNPPRTGASRADLGHLRKMTGAEVDDYLFQKAQRDKDALERSRRADFAVENASRAKAGLPAQTFEEFMVKRTAEYQKTLERNKELGAMAARSREEILK